MAKSSRSSARKNNAHRRATNINAPVEQARAERLSAKLVELANAPKPESSDVNMDGELRQGYPQRSGLLTQNMTALNEAIEKDDAGKDEPDADETSEPCHGNDPLTSTNKDLAMDVDAAPS